MTTSALAARMDVEPAVGDRDDEAARRARTRRAGAVPRRDADRGGAPTRARGAPPPPTARALSRRIGSGCRSTTCTPRRTASSTRSPRSSRRGSTPRSATRPTTRTVTRSRTASCGSRSGASARWTTSRPASARRSRAFPDGDPELLRYLDGAAPRPGVRGRGRVARSVRGPGDGPHRERRARDLTRARRAHRRRGGVDQSTRGTGGAAARAGVVVAVSAGRPGG